MVVEHPIELLERDRELAGLAGLLEAVRAERRGHLVLVGGEAGVGKTALLRRCAADRPPGLEILWGSCDPLFTPRPLAPVLDVAEAMGGTLGRALAGNPRPSDVAAALVEDLSTRPAVLVLEDLHWADEATLDVVRILGRRVASVPALVIATYRDDELAPAHPLRRVLGELARVDLVSRMRLAPLSPVAVRALAARSEVDPAELYRVTGGNPFFVTEVLAAGGDIRLPATVRDAVLARAALLPAAARILLQAVAVVPPMAELWLLETLTAGRLEQLEECLGSGMLAAVGDGIAFRHELARVAIEESLPPHRRQQLHRLALSALAEPPLGVPDLARLSHHAEAAGDAEAVLRFAPAAAERAAALGAHREAAAHYARALRFGAELPTERRAELLERRSFECYVTDQPSDAIACLESAIGAYRELGDARREAAALTSLAARYWCAGDKDEAERTAHEAFAVAQSLPPGPELASACTALASYYMNVDEVDAAVSWGTRAIELAERFDDTRTLVHALNDTGTAEAIHGRAGGLEKLERSLEQAQRAGLREDAGRAYIHLAWIADRTRRHDLLPRTDAGIEYCSEHGLDLWLFYVLTHRARVDLNRGRWSDAADRLSFVIAQRSEAVLLRTLVLSTLGLLRARRGDPDALPPLDEALALARTRGELAYVAPVAAARAEAAWLRGEHEAAMAEADTVLPLAIRRGAAWFAGELGFWRWQAGAADPPPERAAEPYALQMHGDWRGAFEGWTRLGCPYEAALALADADDEAVARRALDALQALGARPAATIVMRRLRERGTRGLPRGPRRSTRQNPANLTVREVEVLRLAAVGLRNAAIGQRLFVSEKTVDHHISAILRKLDVRTRTEAAAAAAGLGLLTQPPPAPGAGPQRRTG